MTVANAEGDGPLVKIVFDGVVAVGPGRPEGKNEQKGPFFAVMANSSRHLSDRTSRMGGKSGASGAKATSKTEPDYFVHMHVPTIFTRLKPADGSRPPDQILQLSPLHDPWYIWHPMRERLEFRPDDKCDECLLEYPEGPGPITFPAARGHYLDDRELSFHPLENVPHLHSVWPARDELLDGLLSSVAPVDQKVMTQVLVPWGTVVGAGVLEQGKPKKIEFEPEGNCKEMEAVPSAAIVVQAQAVTIASYSLDSGEPLDSIKLDAPDGGEVWVSNGDPSDVQVDMTRLSIEVLKRLIGKKDWKLPGNLRTYFPTLPKLFVKILNGFGGFLAVKFLSILIGIFHHHQSQQSDLLRRLHNTGDFDLDFELFYPLMKDTGAMKIAGLPVPKRAADTGGPDCYNCVCRTSAKLAFLSNSEGTSKTQ